jgi:hypothetical protein
LLTLEQLTDIIARGEQLYVEFKSDRRTISLSGLTNDEIAVVEGRNRGTPYQLKYEVRKIGMVSPYFLGMVSPYFLKRLSSI